MHIMPLADQSRGFNQMMRHPGLAGTVIDHDERSAQDQIVGYLCKDGRGVKEAEGKTPGQKRLRSDKWKPGCNELRCLCVPSVIGDDIVGVGQVVNMTTGIINAATPVAVQSVAVYFDSYETCWMKECMQGCGIGKIGTSDVADVLFCRNGPLQGLFGAVQEIQIGVIEKRGLRRQRGFKSSMVDGGQFIDSATLGIRECGESSGRSLSKVPTGPSQGLRGFIPHAMIA